MQTEPMKTLECVKVLRKECEHFLLCVLVYILYGCIMALRNIASFLSPGEAGWWWLVSYYSVTKVLKVSNNDFFL